MDLATKPMGHVVHVQLDIMAVTVMSRALQTVKTLSAIKILVHVHMDVPMDTTSLSVMKSVQIIVLIVVQGKMEHVTLVKLVFMGTHAISVVL